MKTTYLVAVSVLMLAVAVVGLLMTTVLLESLPPTIPDRIDSFGDVHSRAGDIDSYRAFEDSGVARALAGPTSVAEVDRSARAHDADRKDDALAEELADAIRSADLRAREHAGIAIALFAALALAGVLGLGRLRAPGLAALGGGALAIASAIGAILLIVTGGGEIATIVVPPCLIALVAQAIAANLLPDPPIRAIARLERRLRALTPIERRAYIATRIGVGIASASAGLLTIALTTHAPSPSFATIATVVIATGAAYAVVPLIAFVRVRIGGRDLPIARVISR